MSTRSAIRRQGFVASARESEPAGLTQAILDALPARAVVIDDDGVVLAANASWGAFPHSVVPVGASYFAAWERADADDPGSAADAVLSGLRALLAGTRDVHEAEYLWTGPDRVHRIGLHASRLGVRDRPTALVQHHDITEHRHAEHQVELHADLLDAVDTAVVATDVDGAITAWNRAAEALYGWTFEEVLGRPADELLAPGQPSDGLRALPPGGRWEGEIIHTRRSGDRFPSYSRISTLCTADGEIAGFVSVSVDHTAQLQAEQDLRSAHDYMRAVADSMGDGLCTVDERGAIVYVNPRAEQMLGWTHADLAGRDVHDAIHRRRPDGSELPASECPLAAARATRDAARIEDDVLVTRSGTLLPVQQVQTPFETEDGVGGFVLLFTDTSGRKQRELEAEGKLRDLDWIARIHDALDHDRFVLHAQPIVDVATGACVQHELLIRMVGGDGKIIGPGEFLPVAEAYGLVGEIDRWVISQGVRLAATGHPVELNLSAHSVSDPRLYDFIDAELRREGADPGLLVFELTETALLDDGDAAFTFATLLRARGCGLALDDFGTGYGGFSYLKRLPLDVLKIDIEFIRDLTTDDHSRQVVRAVVELARGFGVKTVAEGVETAATLDLLGGLGVDYAQGFHTGRPGPIGEAFDLTELAKR